MGKQTIFFKTKPCISAVASLGGPKESQFGAVAKNIDIKLIEDMFGEETDEKAERKMMCEVIERVLKKSGKTERDIDALIAGDLLNQIISASYSARCFDTAYIGVYNACATFSEAIALGAAMIDGGYMQNVVCAASSHFSSAERQYRYPLELGSTRPPQAQWTVTGAGATILSPKGSGVKVFCATFGKVIDYGITDANNMGAAMAPAAADTLAAHFNETGFSPSDYDLIVTGDLGAFGSRVLKKLIWEKGFDIEKQHVDCGELVYNISEQDYQGGSGAGCSAMVFSAYLYAKLKSKELKRILFIPTGALLSATSTLQNDSIPSVAHAVGIES